MKVKTKHAPNMKKNGLSKNLKKVKTKSDTRKRKKNDNPSAAKHSDKKLETFNEPDSDYYDDQVSSDNDAKTDDEGDLTEEKHAAALKNLQNLDPEFYDFLKSNDKDLLEFGEDEKDEEDEKQTTMDEDDSGESDFEDGNASGGVTKITLKLIEQWKKDVKKNKSSIKPLTTVVRGFHAALLRVIGEDDNKECKYKVDGSSIFNGVVRICVQWLYPSLIRVLKLPSSSISKKQITNSKKWASVKSVVRSYIVDLIKLIGNVTSAEILSVLLKHFHQMCPFVSCLPTINKPILKRLIALWSRKDDDTVRVVSFLCILRLTTCDTSLYLQPALKMMYMAYIANSKFVSPNTLAGINFTRRSLSEMFMIDDTVSYNHAFLYIRQLAIHLRSAVVMKKKESRQSVYNWQYVASLNLWSDVLSGTLYKPQMQSLLYPTVQIIIGCIKLMSTAQYLPLRFHCINMLIKLSKETSVFIPILPFLVEALHIVNVNSNHKKMSMKPMDFTCVLRLTKAQLQENAFKDAVIEQFYHYTLQYLAAESHRFGFPDLVIPLVLQVKGFIKQCKNGNYNKKLKQLLDKVEENSKLIENERNKCTIALSDESGIKSWEENMKNKGTPLNVFYDSWFKLHQKQQNRKITTSIELNECPLPSISKKTKKRENKQKEDEQNQSQEKKKKKSVENDEEDEEEQADEIEDMDLSNFLA